MGWGRAALVSVRNPFTVQTMLRNTRLLGDVPTTKGAYQNLLKIALPSVAEMVLISLIGSFDTLMVSVLGDYAVSAVGLCGQPRMLLLSLFFALNTGVTAIIARRKGEGRQADANRTLRNALILGLAVSAVMMVAAYFLAEPLLRLAQAQSDTIRPAMDYFNTLIWFLPVNGITMCICAAQRGIGNTRITMYVNIASNLVNLCFNYVLIGGNFGFPRMEVTGAALATGIGYVVGLVLCLITVYDSKKNAGFLRLSRHDDWRPDKDTMRSIAKISGSAMIEQVALRIGFFSYSAIVAGLGTLVNAAHIIVAQFQNISFSFADGLGVAGTALVGQNLGQKRPDLSVLYGKTSQRLALVVALVLASIIVVFRYPLVSLFSKDAYVVGLAANVMLLLALFQPLQTSSVVISGCLRGAGDTTYVAVVMFICVTLIRPLLSMLTIYIIQTQLNMPDIALMGAWAASIVDMCTRLICVYRRFVGGRWHDIKV